MRYATVMLAMIIVLVAAPAWAADSEARDSQSERVEKWVVMAEQGNLLMMVNLGMMYEDGTEVPQDYEQAAYWFRRCAEQDFMMGQYMLGMAYLNGRGVTMSKVQAHLWLNLAAAKGYDRAQRDRDLLAEKMTTAQIADAQRLAREWKLKQ